ncbi:MULTISPECIES: transposase [Aeromonas]|uniref:transposase n=1 Tax=Aeromonas TaxID=642 RepID=UPI003AAA20F3
MPACPGCQSSHVIHWGRSWGQQHYRCKTCGKTFNQLNGPTRQDCITSLSGPPMPTTSAGGCS